MTQGTEKGDEVLCALGRSLGPGGQSPPWARRRWFCHLWPREPGPEGDTHSLLKQGHRAGSGDAEDKLSLLGHICTPAGPWVWTPEDPREGTLPAGLGTCGQAPSAGALSLLRKAWWSPCLDVGFQTSSRGKSPAAKLPVLEHPGPQDPLSQLGSQHEQGSWGSLSRSPGGA